MLMVASKPKLTLTTQTKFYSAHTSALSVLATPARRDHWIEHEVGSSCDGAFKV